MGALFSGGPDAPPPPKLPPPPPQMANGLDAARSQKRKAINANGPGSTDATGSQGLTAPATTAKVSLLGG